MLRRRRITLAEVVALVAGLVFVVGLGSGLGLAAVRIERAPGGDAPLRIVRPGERVAPVLNRDRRRLDRRVGSGAAG